MLLTQENINRERVNTFFQQLIAGYKSAASSPNWCPRRQQILWRYPGSCQFFNSRFIRNSLKLRLRIELLNSSMSPLRINLSEAVRKIVCARTELSKHVIMSYVWESRFEDFYHWIDDVATDPISPSPSNKTAYHQQRSEASP